MLNGTEIQEKIPHRYPFLLLDRVLEVGPERAVGVKNVTVSEPFFQGHFPKAPVMPGVLVLESLMQLAWVMFSESGGFRLKGVKRLKFRRPTLPGDRLDLEVTVSERSAEQCQLKAVAKVGEELAVSGVLVITPGR